MEIRDATPGDWAGIWPFLSAIDSESDGIAMETFVLEHERDG